MKKSNFIFTILIIFSNYTALNADVIELQDGAVYLGNIEVNDRGIIIDSFGTKKSIRQEDILKTDNTTENISKKSIQIKLQDGSVLKGNIKNYDDDIGLLLNTHFGIITIPSKGIKDITNFDQKNLYQGIPMLIGVNTGYYLPLGDFKKNYSNNQFFGAFIETNAYLFRGLYIGLDINYMIMDYKTNSDLNYKMYFSRAYAMYRFLEPSLSQSFINRIIPFVLAGGGLSYISVNDNRKTAVIKERNEMDTNLIFGAGFDIRIIRTISIRAQYGLFTIIQSKLYNSNYFNVGAHYGF